MVTCLLLASAALSWPWRRRAPVTGGWMRGAFAGRTERDPGRGRMPGGGMWRRAHRLLAPVGGFCVAAVCFVVAGVAGLMAAGAAVATGTMLVHRALADRRARVALVDIRGGLALLGRELRSGAEPSVAAINASAAARGEGAVVLHTLARLARSDDRSDIRSSVGVDPTKGHAGPSRAAPTMQALARLRSGWLLTRRHGLAFTPLIDALAEDLAEQIAAEGERAGQVAGPRMSGYVMAVLPLMGLALGVGMGADPFRVLLTTPVGNILLLVGVLLTCAGLLWSARIVRR